jgi:hypothetical protein
MPLPWTFVEHDILVLDATRGISYQSFDDFWEHRMEPMQFIAPDAQGVLAVVREKLRERAKEQFALFCQHRLTPAEEVQQLPTIHSDGCGSQPQAGEACEPIDNAASFDVYPEEPSHG